MRWLPEITRRIDFEFVGGRTSGAGAAWLLLVMAVAFAADAGRSYLSLRSALASLSAQISAASFQDAAPAKPSYEPKDVDKEFSLARATIRKIALPWNDLFKALAAADSEGVALLSVDPDADGGSLEITAAARDFRAMLTYFSRLEAHPFFPRTILTRHEIRKDSPQRPVYFVVSATWRSR